MGHLLCPVGGFFCHSTPKIVIASIVADRCFVDVTSVKFFAPELYLKQKQYTTSIQMLDLNIFTVHNNAKEFPNSVN